MVAAGLQRIGPDQAVHRTVDRPAGPGEGTAAVAAGQGEAGLRGRTGELHIRQILEEGVQGFADRAQGCMELDCMAQGYKVAAVAAVHMTAVLLEEDASSHPVAVVHIVAAVHIAAEAAAVHIGVVVVPATGIHRPGDREIVCSVACRAGAALDMVSLVAELAQQMRRRQPDVLREACRGRVGSRSRSRKMLNDVEVVESTSGWVSSRGCA